MSSIWDKWWKKKDDSGPTIEELRQEMYALESLAKCPGWAWMVKNLIERSESIVTSWTTQEHKLEGHTFLAGQVRLIDEILALPEERYKELSRIVTPGTSEEDDGEEIPDETSSLSPVPNEGD